jgi:hypothetical protein
LVENCIEAQVIKETGIHASVEVLASPAHDSSLAAMVGQYDTGSHVDPLIAEVRLLLKDHDASPDLLGYLLFLPWMDRFKTAHGPH